MFVLSFLTPSSCDDTEVADGMLSGLEFLESPSLTLVGDDMDEEAIMDEDTMVLMRKATDSRHNMIRRVEVVAKEVAFSLFCTRETPRASGTRLWVTSRP